MRTKVKTPTLAQNARMGHPNFNTQNLDTQISKPGIQNHKEGCVGLSDAAHGTFYLASTFRLILKGTRLAFG